jgi:glycerate kinase
MASFFEMSALKVLIVPDKFKGTLRADEAAEAIAAGWRSARPEDVLELLPMSDGGDGFGEIIGALLQANRETISTVNAAHEPVRVSWWWSESSRTAIVESASVIGLAMLPPGLFHPFELDTLGLGQLLLRICHQHPQSRLIAGIGGSATNDGGFGMARGLGYRFMDLQDYHLDRWARLDGLQHIRALQHPISFSEVIIATDVQNRLLGPQGASRIYGPQKGLRPEDFPIAERCLTRLTEVVRSDLGLDCAEEPGTGAAGGLGYGLRVFLNGKFEPGFDIFARLSNLEQKIAAADLVITAEGAIDAQTDMGKGTGAIAKLARAQKRRSIGLAGFLPQKENRAFDLALAIAPELTDVEESKRNAAPWLQKLAALASTKFPTLLLGVLALAFAACQSSQRPPNRADSPEARAVAYLVREVPAWSRNNGCFSCHNNGDGARALFAARKAGYDVPGEALADTLEWLKRPQSWDENKGDPSASDKQLADIQFAKAVLAAYEVRLIRDRGIIDQAALRLLRHQSQDGSFDVEPQNPVGSPVTYGTTLATYFAWEVISASKHNAIQAAGQKARRWLYSLVSPKNNPEAAALLLREMDRTSDGDHIFSLHKTLRDTQTSSGGLGPYRQSPPEIFDTALAVLALSHVGDGLETPSDTIQRARTYLVSQQNPDGSWAPTTRPTGGESYAQQISTTAWATMALIATADHFTSNARSTTSRVMRFWTSENKSTSNGFPTLFPAKSSIVVCTRSR